MKSICSDEFEHLAIVPVVRWTALIIGELLAINPDGTSPSGAIGEANARKSVVQFEERGLDRFDNWYEIVDVHIVERGRLQDNAKEVASCAIVVGFYNNILYTTSNGRIVSQVFNTFLEDGKFSLLHLRTRSG